MCYIIIVLKRKDRKRGKENNEHYQKNENHKSGYDMDSKSHRTSIYKENFYQ